MNTKSINSAVADLLQDQKVMNMPLAKLIDEAILPRVMGLPGTDAGCRYRITDRYMKFIADYADDILYMDHYRGVVCLKLALQRFARSSAYPTAPIDYKDLPENYKRFSAMHDEVGTLSEECWYFFRKQIGRCLHLEETKDYAQKLMLGLVANISIDGQLGLDVYLGNLKYHVDAKQTRDWAYDQLYHHCGWQVIYDYFAKPNMYNKVPDLWALDWHNIDKKDLAKRLGVKGLFKERKLKKMLGLK